jgi:hypothetical protein
MADDWRLTVDFDDEHDGVQLVERLGAREFEHAERKRLGDRVIVSRDSARVLFYADSESVAREVEQVVRRDLEGETRPAVVSLEVWHPVEEVWKDASEPVPTSSEALEAEREARLERETQEALSTGHAEWEVRVELPDHAATTAAEERLEGEGYHVVRRSRYLLIGAVNEEEAGLLAKRLAEELPEATVHVQPGGEMVWEVTPTNPFAILGGLGT